MSKYLYLPIETTSREFDSKLWLAIEAASQKGIVTYLGAKTEIYSRLPKYAKGVVLEKSIQITKAKKIKEISKFGHKFTVLCEEGLNFLSSSDYCNRKVGKETLGLVEKCFCWGEKQYNAISDIYPEEQKKLVLTGNPRMNLFSIDDFFVNDAENIKSKYGNFVLLNTKFARTNYLKSKDDDWIVNAIKKGYISDNEQKELMEMTISHEKHLISSYKSFIRKFEKYSKDLSLVIRPHPSEDVEFWDEIASKFRNVFVDNQGSVNPWIFASELVISSNCTTSIEARLLHRESVNYRPYLVDRAEYSLPKKVGLQVYSEEDLLKIIKLTSKKLSLNQNKKSILTMKEKLEIEDYFPIPTFSAVDNIIEHVDKLYSNLRPTKKNNWIKDTFLTLKIYLRKRAYDVISNPSNSELARQRRHATKFKPILKNEVELKLRKFPRRINTTYGYKIRYINPKIIKIYPTTNP
jgi:surface carbohydrate biosynthesis protein